MLRGLFTALKILRGNVIFSVYIMNAKSLRVKAVVYMYRIPFLDVRERST
jgi:hypothetical protein